MRTVLGMFYFGVLFALVIFSALATFSAFAGPGNFRLLTVQSGSMEPSLKFGSIILVLPKGQKMLSPISPWSKFQKGEIITYSSGEETFTHRIVSVEQTNGQIFYKTKGDANPGTDVEKVPEDKVIGRVAFSLPYLGYLISFAKTQVGFIALIIIPATIVVYSEILNIGKEFRKIFLKRKIAEV